MMEQIFSTIFYIFMVLVGFGALVFVHELGHFLAAKWMGVRVEMFALGFGRRLIAFKRGDTEYSVRWIPLGGFVKMAGVSDLPGEKPTGASDEFPSKSPGRRAIIIAAGVFMNFIFAILILIIGFLAGMNFTSPEIGDVVYGTPAYEAKLQPGDIIKKINGKKIFKFESLTMEVALNGERPMTVEYERGGKTHSVEITPKYNPQMGFAQIGIGPSRTNELYANGTRLAEEYGLQNGDKIVEIDGKKITPENTDLVSEYIICNPGKTLAMKFERDSEILEKEILIKATKAWNLGFFGEWNLKIDNTIENSPGEKHFKKGDRIISIGGNPVYTPQEVKHALFKSGGKPMTFTLLREGQQKPVEVTFNPYLAPGKNSHSIGIIYAQQPKEDERFMVGTVMPNSPADKAGMKPGDSVLNIKEIYAALTELAQQSATSDEITAKPVEIKWSRNGQAYSKKLVPELYAAASMGIPNDFVLHLNTVIVRAEGSYGLDNLANATGMAWDESTVIVGKTYLFLSRLLTNEVSAKNLAGPGGVLHITYKSAEAGPSKFIYILALISLNLAIVNLLPIPVLDGGHLVFLVIEKIKGSPVNERVLEYVTYIGLVMLGGLMLFATYNDISRWFGI